MQRRVKMWFMLLGILSTSQGVFGLPDVLTFPKNFMLGTATAAYQIEGAWNESGEFKCDCVSYSTKGLSEHLAGLVHKICCANNVIVGMENFVSQSA
jgi:hypothetical protein